MSDDHPPEETQELTNGDHGHEDSNMERSIDASLPSNPLPAGHGPATVSHETPTENTPSDRDSAAPGPKSPVKVPATSVKKVLSSGTFGAGSVKPPVSKVAASSVKQSTSTSPIKRTASGPPPLKSSMPPKASATAATPAPVRRASLAPKAPTPTIARAPLASSAATKPSRLSIAPSPDSTASLKSASTARPRASVSGEAKRTTSISKPAASTVVRPSGTTTPRLTRTPGVGSISSIKELKVDEKSLELQQKLNDVTASLSSRDNTVAELESKLTGAKVSLDAALAELDAKRLALKELEQVKAGTQDKLKEARDSLQALQAERQADNSAAMLEAVQGELQASRATLLAEKEAVQLLQSQIESLEVEITTTKTELEALRFSSQSASTDAAAKHTALLRAKEDLDVIKAETENLKASHFQALDEATSKVRALETTISNLYGLEGELASLKQEKEESANRISELEIEVLEARESVEQVEDDQAKAVLRTKSLEEELAKVIATSELALKIKDDEYIGQAEVAKTQHQQELASLRAEQELLSSQLVKLEDRLADAQVSLEKAQADHFATAEEHAMNIQSMEQTNQDVIVRLRIEFDRVAKELEDQENIYSAKVDVVKEEHEQRLQEAFQRANDLHAVDLHALRVESHASIEQVRSAYEATIQNLKAEHGATLDDQVKALEKQLLNQNLELKATQDDLAKAKAALISSLQELELMKLQLEGARKNAESIASSAVPDYSSELVRLKKELADAREDQAAIHDVLGAQKESFTQMTENHAKELEEAATGRAEEVTKLRTAHEVEVTSLTTEKSELTAKLSDVEGELATLRATLGAEPVSAPKGNGAAQPISSGVTKEEIQRMHEAHNLKMNDVQAEFEKTLKALKEDLETARTKASELELEVTRKTMEISYLELDQEESQDQITRLKEDMDHLSEQLKAKE